MAPFHFQNEKCVNKQKVKQEDMFSLLKSNKFLKEQNVKFLHRKVFNRLQNESIIYKLFFNFIIYKILVGCKLDKTIA